jgi:hypothetical protein
LYVFRAASTSGDKTRPLTSAAQSRSIRTQVTLVGSNRKPQMASAEKLVGDVSTKAKPIPRSSGGDSKKPFRCPPTT